jgi:hypothetical protein
MNVHTDEEVEADRGAAGLGLPGKVRASNVWDRIMKNVDERYHFLQVAPPEDDALGQGLPELTVDFKRYFTLTIEELTFRILTPTTLPSGATCRSDDRCHASRNHI